jgi:hypothetical protein
MLLSFIVAYMRRLRDILYFDLDKATSLISQIDGGLAQSRTEAPKP